MKVHWQSIILIMVGFILGSNVVAKESSADKTEEKSSSTNVVGTVLDAAKSGIETTIDTIVYPWVFGGADLGLGSVKTKAKGETNMSGSYRAVRGDISFYYDWLTLEE